MYALANASRAAGARRHDDGQEDRETNRPRVCVLAPDDDEESSNSIKLENKNENPPPPEERMDHVRPHDNAYCPPGMIRRDPVSFSVIGRRTMLQEPPATTTLSTTRATVDGGLPPLKMATRQLSKEPVAMAVTDDEQDADEENDVHPVVATQKSSSRFSLENKRLWICLIALLVLILICGAVAGTVVALLASRDNDSPPAPSLPFTPTLPLPPSSAPSPDEPPIAYEFQQVGSSLFEEQENVGATTANVSLGPRGEVYFGWAVDLSSNGQRLVATSPYYSSAYIFDLKGTLWTKSATIAHDAQDGFLDHIALSGDSKILAVGMPGNNDVHVFGGKVQVYEESSTGSWQKRGDAIFGNGTGHLIGGHFDLYEKYNDTNRTGDIDFSTESFDSSSLALSKTGNVLAIGSSSSNTVQVFEYNNSKKEWMLLKTFMGESARDRFGTSVDLSADGQRIIIGAPNNIGKADPDFEIYNGHVRVFHRLENGTWIQLGQDIDGTRGEKYAGEQSGSSVSISEDGSTISIGATLEASSEDIYALGDNDGSVKVYQYDESKQEWRQNGNTINVFQFGLLGIDTDEIEALVAGLGSEKFPIVARLSGDGKRVALSALAESLNDVSGRGVIRLYELRGEVWEIIANPVEGTMAFDHSGRSIALSFDGSRVAVGSPEHNNLRPNDGQVRVFEVKGLTGGTSKPTTAPSPTPTIGSTRPSVPILVALNVKAYVSDSESSWLLECGGILVANRTVIGSENVTETFLVEDGGVCQVTFSSRWTIEMYTIYYGQNDLLSPIIINGTSPDRDSIVFHVTPNAASITVVIQPDAYISETSWSLYCEGELFASVPLGELYGSDTFTETIMGIKEQSSCQFVLTDAFGDGICCDGGTGFYRLYFGDNATAPGAILAEGGEFEVEERVDFVVAPGPTLAPTSSPAPTTTPSPTRPVSAITIFLQFDNFPSETGWSLYCDDALLVSIPTGSYSSDLQQQNVTETFQINEGAECRFTITDGSADGICCEYGNGLFRIFLGDNVQDGILVYEGGEFEQTEVVSFTVEDGQVKLT